MRTAIVVLALLAACTGTAPNLVSVPDANVAVGLSPDEFPGAATLLSGFDQREADAKWRPGDQMLFGLRLRKGGTTKRWLLHLAVAPPPTLTSPDGTVAPLAVEVKRVWNMTWSTKTNSQQLAISSVMLPVAVTVAAEDGAVLGRSEVQLPAELLAFGIVRAIEICLASVVEGAPVPELAEADVRSFGAALFGLIALLEVFQNDKVLADYFWQVVEKPGIWSVLTSLGVEAKVRLEFQKSVPAASLPPHLPPTGRAFVAPMQIDVNETPALLIDVVAADPARPCGLTGGMLAVAARHPTQKDLRLDAVLLAARLGPAPEQRPAR